MVVLGWGFYIVIVNQGGGDIIKGRSGEYEIDILLVVSSSFLVGDLERAK